MVLYGSNLGDANAHSTTNLRLFAGGGFRHGQHLAFDPTQLPLPNLFVSMLQRMGIEAALRPLAGTMRGLEIV